MILLDIHHAFERIRPSVLFSRADFVGFVERAAAYCGCQTKVSLQISRGHEHGKLDSSPDRNGVEPKPVHGPPETNVLDSAVVLSSIQLGLLVGELRTKVVKIPIN